MLFENCDLLAGSGFTKPIARAEMEDRISVVQTVTLHEILLKSKEWTKHSRCMVVLASHNYLYICDFFWESLISNYISFNQPLPFLIIPPIT